ncbi:MAG: serine/threonine-protein kinase, partial [Acidobacteriota bacterium]
MNLSHSQRTSPATRQGASRWDTQLPTEVSTPRAAARPGDPEAATPAPATGAAPAAEEARQVGPFRIVERLGQGGMGTVYLAEQTEPVERRVALKVMRRSLSGPQARARFEIERRALARLAHPNVAQMLEAGTTDEGFPYFAMEPVDGAPLTAHCDRERLTVRERLRLFCEICAGVQHAHVRQILHRDLKPANLLVARIDGRSVVKIIDFGIARTLDDSLALGRPELGRSTLSTPAYMSLEALAGDDGPGVDTRTDVFSLGIVLYELIAGVRPLPDVEPIARRRALESGAWPSLDRPSLTGDLDAEDIAAHRRLSPAHLQRYLRGDFEAIVRRAIHRDRERRYQSAVELAEDIERLLAHRPVRALPATPLYRARRWLRRNRVPAVAASLALAGLVGGLVTRGQEADRARRAADRAEAALAEAEDITQIVIQLFQTANPDSDDGQATVRQLLDR